MNKYLLFVLYSFFISNLPPVLSQTIIGGTNRDPSAILELRSTDKGLLLPRLTLEQRNAIPNPATGLVIFNTSLGCVEANIGTPTSSNWICLSGTSQPAPVTGSIINLICDNVAHLGLLISGQAATNVNTTIYYTGGNGGSYMEQTIQSTGVTGLTATLTGGNFASGSGALTYTITGIPASGGTAYFSVSIGGLNCTFSREVGLTPGGIITLSCDGISLPANTLVANQAVDNLSFYIPYVGSGGVHGGQQALSIGVSGLSATLSAGIFETGIDSLLYNVSGIPSGCGKLSFAINIGGQVCTIDGIVNLNNPNSSCGACIAPNVWKEFQCHNLGADTNADPFTPGWELNGNYYQWGRSVIAASGPTGPESHEANEDAITGWNTNPATNLSWVDAIKTPNDPCPQGYRVPSRTVWDGVTEQNNRIIQGSWIHSHTNYGSGAKFGQHLFLPAAGLRSNTDNGYLLFRGSNGQYWSSTSSGTLYAIYMAFDNFYASTSGSYRTNGFSIRCLKE